MRRRLFALVASLSLALAFAPALPGSAKTRAPAKVRNDYNAYLKDHLKLEPVLRGRRLMAEKTQIPASLIARKQREQAQAAAADPCESTDKPVGCTDSFWVSNRIASQDYEGQFILAAKSPHSYIWVDRTAYDPTGMTGNVRPGTVTGTVTQAEAELAAERFEKIWEVDRSYFGHEANPLEKPHRTPPRLPDNWRDADGDVHINIVNFPMDTIGASLSYTAGYFSSADEYPVEVNPHSNEGEFFYMNSLMLTTGGDTYAGVLAHEFYHMIQFANDATEATWINEGMADIAIEVNAIPGLTEGHMSAFFAEPAGDQLTHWGGQIIDYGAAYAFLTYLFEHYGGPDNPATSFKENYLMAEAITKVAEDDMPGLDVVLRSNPQKSKIDPYYRNKNANDVFLDWAVANFLDDTAIGAGQYGYRNVDQKVPATATYDTYPAALPADGDDPPTITPYTNRYYKFSSAGDGGVELTADRLVKIVDNLDGIPSGTHEYWGNRVDESETMMTRAADLRGTSAPELSFWYWYDIETDWDYAYLEVSQDAGKSWEFVVCCESTSTNPNGNNDAVTQGAGITGQSGVNTAVEQVVYQLESQGEDPRGTLGISPAWVEETVDLSDYAGKQVLIRFRYSTDPAVTNPGFTVDDISLKDGGKVVWVTDTAEAATSPWAFEGSGAATFLRITPQITNVIRPLVIKFGAETVVSAPGVTTSGDESKAGEAMDALNSVLVVTSISPITSESFEYGFAANASEAADITAPVLDEIPEQLTLPYPLRWKPASKSGKFNVKEYLVEETTVFAELLKEDAENGLDKWETETAGVVLDWQTSSDTSHSDPTSFSARGVEGAGEADALLTMKDFIQVPSRGSTELRLWSWFLNEGDDSGNIEASSDGENWKTLTSVVRSALAPDAAPDVVAGRPMTEVVVPLDSFKGQPVKLRFRYHTGPDNRAGSTPLGWYIDDIAVQSTDWAEIGRTAQTSFTLTHRPTGTNNYRVGALYTENLLGPWSDTVGAAVKGGSTVRGGTNKPLPATGVGTGLGGILLLMAAFATNRWVRRRPA
ncbi:MAG: hypothetical protein WEB06_18595 [Actinomycetota bacterium]